MEKIFCARWPLLLAICVLGVAMNAAAADVAYRKLARAALPAELPLEGEFVAAVAWADATGENYAVLTDARTLRHGRPESSALRAVGYRVNGAALQPVWRVKDGIDDCDLDMISFFEASSLEVTDLDHNGVGEVSFVYRQACNGGVDLIEEKLFLVEDGRKYPIRGGTEPRGAVVNDRFERFDGPMKVDKAYDNAPPAFKSFAIAKWRRFRRPTGW